MVLDLRCGCYLLLLVLAKACIDVSSPLTMLTKAYRQERRARFDDAMLNWTASRVGQISREFALRSHIKS